MPYRTLSFAADQNFVEALDRAVTQYRRANADRNVSRATFMRDAIDRAVAEMIVDPEIRTRRRETVRPGAVVPRSAQT